MIKKFKPRKRKQKILFCFCCKEKIVPSFREVETLKRFISERGKIISREDSGICQKHQKELTIEVKRARFLAILPFLVRPS
jgi:small subunit ribosomal protein S18